MEWKIEIENLATREAQAMLPPRDRILCSRVFYEDVVRREPARQDAFFFCGSAHLKGIEKPVDIYCVNLRPNTAHAPQQARA